MGTLYFINRLTKTVLALMIISSFVLSLNPVYADNDRLSDNTTSYKYSEHFDNSDESLRISVLNEFSSNSTIAKSDNLRYAQSEIDKTSSAISSNNYGSGSSAKDWSF